MGHVLLHSDSGFRILTTSVICQNLWYGILYKWTFGNCYLSYSIFFNLGYWEFVEVMYCGIVIRGKNIIQKKWSLHCVSFLDSLDSVSEYLRMWRFQADRHNQCAIIPIFSLNTCFLFTPLYMIRLHHQLANRPSLFIAIYFISFLNKNMF